MFKELERKRNHANGIDYERLGGGYSKVFGL